VPTTARTSRKHVPNLPSLRGTGFFQTRPLWGQKNNSGQSGFMRLTQFSFRYSF
jgi:hypothetical protein